MDKIKTVLAPNAPWPKAPEPPKAATPPKVKPAPKVKPPPRSKSKIKNTDERFKLWAEKNL